MEMICKDWRGSVGMKGFFKLLRNLLTYQEGSSDTEFVLKEAAEAVSYTHLKIFIYIA